MANGEKCKHCGYQEADHYEENWHRFERPDRRLPGYRRTLMGCSGFEEKRKRMSRKERESESFRMSAIEQYGEFRSAWGLYSAITRQQNFDEQVERLDHEIRLAGTGEAERKARNKKDTFIKECRQSNCLRIG
jgi:hypothetical protein